MTKINRFSVVAVLGIFALLGLTAPAVAGPISFDFSSLDGAAINFDGSGNFGFSNNGSGYGFQITSGPLSGLFGKITGSYAIGSISISGIMQSAPVNNSGNFEISDGSSSFIATATWQSIYTFGTSGALNAGGLMNLTSFSYSGSNLTLLELLGDLQGSSTITFQFTPAKTLTQLKSSANSTSYSGSVYALPEPAIVILIGLGLGAVTLVGWRFRN